MNEHVTLPERLLCTKRGAGPCRDKKRRRVSVLGGLRTGKEGSDKTLGGCASTTCTVSRRTYWPFEIKACFRGFKL